MSIRTNIAITLSFEGIGLLRRAEVGWHLVGDVSLQDPDLGAALTELSDKAKSLEPEGVFAKLVIPNDQIKYLSFDKIGLEADEIADAVRRTLDSATPYELDDLTYDWSIEENTVFVAAVAKETLSEAEHFAAQHGFNPVCAVAIPEAHDFAGEPWFGETKTALTQYKDAVVIDRDREPIRVLGPIPENDPVKEEDVADDDVHTAVSFSTTRTSRTEEPVSFRSIRANQDYEPSTEPSLGGVTRDEIIPEPDEPIEQEMSVSDNDANATEALEGQKAEPSFEPVQPARPLVASISAPTTRPAPAAVVPRRPVLASSTIGSSLDEDEAKRMTVFGARGALEVGGKPKFLGLILTTVLIIFLLGVAAWASIFLKDSVALLFGTEPEAQSELANAPGLSIDSESEADGQFVEDQTARPLEDSTAPSAVADEVFADDETFVVEEDFPETLSPEDALNRYAVTGIWLLAPDAPPNLPEQPLEDVYLTSIDPLVVQQDVVALAPLENFVDDTSFKAPLDPTAPSITFDLDERGLVKATPEGAESPDGIRVFAGRPNPLPPARPAETLEPIAETEQIETAVALAKLGTTRPNARPNDLVEQQERNTLGGRTRLELAKLRPRLRPESEQQIALKEEPAAVTAQAVAASLVPKTRPQGFEKIVRQTQQKQKAQQTQVAAVAVPRTQTRTPKIPTATTVARAATEQNVIALRRINLIGVYGSPSSRRALVRMANGRYKKVKVGDRLDGGRVTAIGDSELRYTKSGRSVALKMPRG